MRIGFIGLGNVGGKLAGSLLGNGFDLTVRDLDRAAARPLLEAGARWGRAGADDGGRRCGHHLPAHPRRVGRGAGGRGRAALGDGRGTDLDGDVDHRRGGGSPARREGESARRRAGRLPGLRRLPSRGHRQHLHLRRLRSLDVRAHPPAAHRHGSPDPAHRTLGSASILKVVTNYLATANLVSCCEAMVTAKAAGLDLNTTWEAMRISSGNSFVHETESQVILNGSRDISFTMDLVSKDVGLFQAIADRCGVPVELSPILVEIFRDGEARYGSRAWSPDIIRRLEDATGLSILAPGFPAQMARRRAGGARPRGRSQGTKLNERLPGAANVEAVHTRARSGCRERGGRMSEPARHRREAGHRGDAMNRHPGECRPATGGG